MKRGEAQTARRLAERRGRRAETIAAWWLRLHGWQVLARRVKVRAGEVDLIARRGRLVAFVEVKARADGDALDLAIDRHRLRRVAAAAAALAPRFTRPGDAVRIDVMLIAPRTLPRHIVNAWTG